MKVILNPDKRPATITDKGDGVQFSFYNDKVTITIGDRRAEVEVKEFRKLLLLTT